MALDVISCILVQAKPAPRTYALAIMAKACAVDRFRAAKRTEEAGSLGHPRYYDELQHTHHSLQHLL